MKRTTYQTDSKQRLNVLCGEFGFEELRKIVKLSGSSLGQYLAHDTAITISDAKLNLAEAELKLLCKTPS